MSSLLSIACASAAAYVALTYTPTVDVDADEHRWRDRKRLLLVCTLTYAAWFAYTINAKHRAAVWGPTWAARVAASVCYFIGWACGLKFDVHFDNEEQGLSGEHMGLVAAVGPHGVFPMAMLGMGGFMFRSDSGYGSRGLVDMRARFAGASIVFAVPRRAE